LYETIGGGSVLERFTGSILLTKAVLFNEKADGTNGENIQIWKSRQNSGKLRQIALDKII